ncbi:MAG TPA: hypothetical protein VIP70_06795, partial [Nitrososphaeraceae archaeon]
MVTHIGRSNVDVVVRKDFFLVKKREIQTKPMEYPRANHSNIGDEVSKVIPQLGKDLLFAEADIASTFNGRDLN